MTKTQVLPWFSGSEKNAHDDHLGDHPAIIGGAFRHPALSPSPPGLLKTELTPDTGRRTPASPSPAEATRDPATTPTEAQRAHRGGTRRHRNRDLKESSTHHFLKSTACGFPCVIGPVAFLGRMSYL